MEGAYNIAPVLSPAGFSVCPDHARATRAMGQTICVGIRWKNGDDCSSTCRGIPRTYVVARTSIIALDSWPESNRKSINFLFGENFSSAQVCFRHAIPSLIIELGNYPRPVARSYSSGDDSYRFRLIRRYRSPVRQNGSPQLPYRAEVFDIRMRSLSSGLRHVTCAAARTAAAARRRRARRSPSLPALPPMRRAGRRAAPTRP